MANKLVLTEAQEQELLVDWIHRQHPELLMWHTPNGGKRSAAEANHLKRLGVVAGVPDIFIPKPSGDRHGLFIELKREHGGTVSPQQKTMLRWLNELGYRAEVCKGWHAAAATVTEYLGDQHAEN